MPEALQKIKQDLGKDAVIIETKKIKSGGFIGFFRKTKLEVIAAVETNNILAKEINSQKETRSIETIKDNDELKRDMQEIKEIMLNYLLYNKQNNFSNAIQSFINQLIRQGIDEKLITDLLQKGLKTNNITNDSSIEDIKKFFYEELYQIINQRVNDNPILDNTKIIQFVGPTGVGKTTTIAKLAADFLIKRNKSIGFITTDTYRVAAVEQLKTYANILNAPIEIVYNLNDLNKALNKLREVDMIFLDTAGRNYRNILNISETKMLLKHTLPFQTFLTISITTKYEDITPIIDHFLEQMEINNIIFTKLDETKSYGTIINILANYPLKLTYVTNGQNVPNDIRKVSTGKIIDLVMGDLSYDI